NRGRLGELPLPEPGRARRQARPGALPAAAPDEEGPAAPRGLPEAPSGEPPRRLRVPQPELAGRRGVRNLAGSWRGPVPFRARGQRPASPGADRPLGLRAAAPGVISRRRAPAVGGKARRRRLGRDLRLLHARADGTGVRADPDADGGVEFLVSRRKPWLPQ